MRRGRPRHDDILTPREWEVLDLLREDLTNEQIAERLGVSLNTVKYHLSEIYSKLGVESRREAALWRGAPRGVLGVAPLLALLLKLKAVSPLKAAGVGAIGAAGVAFAALMVGVVFGQHEPNPGTPLPTTRIGWLPADLAPSGPEAPRPFRASVDDDDDVWRAYFLHPDGVVELVVETQRYLVPSATWTEHRLMVRYATRYLESDGTPGRLMWGLLGFEDGRAVDLWQQPAGTGDAAVSDDATAVLLKGEDGKLYAQSLEGETVRLTGLSYGQPAWSPVGSTFWTSARRFSYLVDLSRQRGIALDTSSDPHSWSMSSPTWSPDGNTFVYTQESDAIIVDIPTATHRRVPLPTGFQPSILPSWSDNGRYLAYSGALLDTAAATLVREPREGPSRSLLSPSAEWMVISYSFESGAPACADDGSRTLVYRVADGTETEIEALACPGARYFPEQWVDATRVLMTGQACARCAREDRSSAILDVTDGSVVHLTGFEPDLRAIATPHGTVIVGGATLREFDATGMLLREVESPDGRRITFGQASPDGSFIYFLTGPLLGPEVFPLN